MNQHYQSTLVAFLCFITLHTAESLLPAVASDGQRSSGSGRAGDTVRRWPLLHRDSGEALGNNDAGHEVSEVSTGRVGTSMLATDRRRIRVVRKDRHPSQTHGAVATSHGNLLQHSADAAAPIEEAAHEKKLANVRNAAWGQVLEGEAPALDNTTSEAEGELSWQPVVYVQEFLPYFPASPPPKLDDLNLTMEAIYGYPVCPGKKSFVNNAADAPPNFCRYSNGQVAMAMEGKRHEDFDQYAMERIMLAKWLESPLRCRKEEEWCKAHADVVVVPSLALHEMVQRGFAWQFSANLTNHGRMGKGAAAYWSTVRRMFYTPATGRTPLIVTHSAFSWDWPGHNEILHALAKEPQGFIQRVVIATTGSNLMPAERALFGKDWHDGGVSLLRQRFVQRRSSGVVSDGGPLLLTVPYPTSLMNEVRFTESHGAYSADRKRPIRVSLFASATKDGKGSNWVRQLLLDRVASKPRSENHSKISMVCEESVTAGANSMCGLSRDANLNMWTITSNSAFCIEPPGDTLCRSHLYVSLLSGCIPVMVDGGHDRFDTASPTWWAWRGTSQDLSVPSPFPDEIQSALLDYNESFVVISADEARNGTDHIQQLVDMPEKDPERYRRLRENVDRIAPLMRYSYTKCSSYPMSAHPYSCRDAFAVFQSIVALESYHAHH